MSSRKVKVLIAKVSLDVHDRGVRVLTQWLRDAGMEVIFLGLNQTVDRVIQSALQEDVDVIGLSFLSGEQLIYVPQMVEKMKENKLDDTLLLVGGVIPDHHIPLLKEMGADEVFIPGTPMNSIVNYINSNVESKK